MAVLPGNVKSAVWVGSILIGIVLLLLGLGKTINLLFALFAAVLFSIFLDALTSRVQRRVGISRGWALTAVTFALILLGALLFAFALPPLTAQGRHIQTQLPRALSEARRSLESAGVPAAIFEQAGQGLILSRAGSFLSGALDVVVGALVIVIIGLYLAANPQRYRQGIANLWPSGSRERFLAVLDDTGATMRRWLVGQMFLMVTNGVFTTIGLYIIGVPSALILGVLAGLFNFVPTLGPFFAAVPAILLSLSQGTKTALAVAGLFLVLQMVDGYVVTPLVEQKAVFLPAALILAFQLFMGILAGLGGIFLATPILTMAKVVFDHIRADDLVPSPGRVLPATLTTR